MKETEITQHKRLLQFFCYHNQPRKSVTYGLRLNINSQILHVNQYEPIILTNMCKHELLLFFIKTYKNQPNASSS